MQIMQRVNALFLDLVASHIYMRLFIVSVVNYQKYQLSNGLNSAAIISLKKHPIQTSQNSK